MYELVLISGSLTGGSPAGCRDRYSKKIKIFKKYSLKSFRAKSEPQPDHSPGQGGG